MAACWIRNLAYIKIVSAAFISMMQQTIIMTVILTGVNLLFLLGTGNLKSHNQNYNDRYLYIKCVEIDDVADGNKGYAYIGLDTMRKEDEDCKLFKRQKITNSQRKKSMT